MKYDPDIHKRQNQRLKEYDYSTEGAYFVTVVAKDRECLFGEIVDSEMVLNDVGMVVRNEFQRTEKLRDNVIIDSLIVMPNHVHTIIYIDRRGVSLERPKNDDIDRATHRIAPTLRPNTSGSIIGQIKSITTKKINKIHNNPGNKIWQRNFYDHIIHDDDDLNQIREYIMNNPINWDEEDENIKSA